MTILIANAIDFVAALLQVGSGFVKKKAKILIIQTVQLLMQGVSILLLGGVTGAVSNILSCYRNYLCYKDKLSNFWKFVLIAASVVMTALLKTQGFLGIMPAAICAVYIIFMDVKDPVKFKLLVTLTFIPWVFYHFALKAYVAAIFDVATVLTNGIALWQMKQMGKNTT